MPRPIDRSIDPAHARARARRSYLTSRRTKKTPDVVRVDCAVAISRASRRGLPPAVHAIDRSVVRSRQQNISAADRSSARGGGLFGESRPGTTDFCTRARIPHGEKVRGADAEKISTRANREKIRGARVRVWGEDWSIWGFQGGGVNLHP